MGNLYTSNRVELATWFGVPPVGVTRAKFKGTLQRIWKQRVRERTLISEENLRGIRDHRLRALGERH